MSRRWKLQILFFILFLFVASDVHGSRARAVRKQKSLASVVFARYPELKAVKDYSLKEQNEIADERNLSRFEKQEDIYTALKSGYLVPVPANSANFYLDPRLSGERRCIAPQALAYIKLFSGKHAEKFGSKKQRLDVTSLARPENWQENEATKGNRNVAPGDIPEHRSLHTTGFTFDFSTKKMTEAEVLWCAQFLAGDMKGGRVWATYEPNTNHFHVFVLPK